ncbi:MAG: hypothetical protein M1817_005010 [Caeruleum heppii]|nr:MAG: hypothetical protein M1817_005010 [Caeruleum heppii]
MAPIPGLDPSQITQKARDDLLGLLEGVQGKKNLVLEKGLAGPIGIFVKFSTLQEYGVDKVFLLENGNVDSSQKNVIFLARGEKANKAQAIAAQIKRLQQNKQVDHDFSVFWVPRRALVSDKILENAGILGDVNLSEFPLYFMPLESDLLSLELEDSFGDLYLWKDPTPIFHSAKALMLFQQRHGLFPRIMGKGDNACRLAELLLRMRSEVAAGESSATSNASLLGLSPSSTVESLIVIDREVDFGTVLLTQLTYEGLIDEVVGIQHNQAEVDSSVVGPASTQQPPQGPSPKVAAPAQQGLKRKIQLDSSDKLFHQLRDTNFAIVGSLLNKVARRLESDYESRRGAKSTTELREFVNKLPGYQLEQQSLKIHTGLAEEVMKFTQTDFFNRSLEVQQDLASGGDASSQQDKIDELISRDAPITTVLRLLCLGSCMTGGLKPRELEYYKRLILQAYGYQHLLTLNALEKLQLLQSRTSNALMLSTASTTSKTNYTYLRRALRLIVDEVNEQDPNDIVYVYSGYAPLSVRLVQCIIQKQHLTSIIKGSSGAANGVGSAAHGWRGFEEVIKNVKGNTCDEVQRGEDKALKARMMLNGQTEKKTVVVFFLGGITFTEVAALRFIAKKEEARRRILICTTSIISGNRMMDAAMEKRTFGG